MRFFIKNIIKIRIIYPFGDSIEADYLKEFFQFIGCAVRLDVVRPSESTYSWDKLLYSENQKDGIDIVLNYKEKKIITGITERFYIDFSLSKDFYSFQNKKYQSAQETCHKSLEYLVDRIWCGDESNRQSIHMLRKLYTEGAEEDLFYYFHLLNNHSPRDTHNFNHHGSSYIPSWPCIHYTPYIEKIVKDFYLLNNQIKGNCNPYVQHAHLYFEQCFYFICSLVDLPNRIKDVKIPICSSLPKLIEKTNVSIGRYPQYESFYIRLAEFFKFNNSRVQAFNCMNKLYEDDKFPYYYQNLGWAMYFIDFDENAHKKRYKEIIQRDPKMYRAKFDYAYCVAKERLYYEAESLF